jgi:tripartite-type tricarboxylate transporter receptor subunit TctC
MVLAPANIPAERVQYLNSKIVEVLKKPEVVEKFSSMGATVVADSPEAARSMLQSEEKTYSDLITRLGIKLGQ